MKCDEIKEQVYEWSKGTLSEKDRPAVEEHLRDCRSCQAYAEQVKHTLSLLNEIKPPSLSVDFKEKVLQKARDLPFPSKPLWERFKEWFQVPYVKWPLEGLAVTAVILIALAIYRDVSLTKPSKIEMIPRSFQLEFSAKPLENPIIIPTKDLNKTLAVLKTLIKDNNGQLIKTLNQDQEIQVFLSLKKENEAAFFAQLKKLGPVKMGEDGFQNEAGNIVVVLKLAR